MTAKNYRVRIDKEGWGVLKIIQRFRHIAALRYILQFSKCCPSILSVPELVEHRFFGQLNSKLILPVS